MSEDKVPYSVRPLACLRDERGEIREQTVKALFAKIDEELNELKDSVVYGVDSGRLLSVAKDKTFCPEYIAEEAADTITAITTMLEALGITRKCATRRNVASTKKTGNGADCEGWKMSKRKIWFLVMVLIVTAIAVAADSFCLAR